LPNSTASGLLLLPVFCSELAVSRLAILHNSVRTSSVAVLKMADQKMNFVYTDVEQIPLSYIEKEMN